MQPEDSPVYQPPMVDAVLETEISDEVDDFTVVAQYIRVTDEH
jgi:hypothetical protein